MILNFKKYSNKLNYLFLLKIIIAFHIFFLSQSYARNAEQDYSVHAHKISHEINIDGKLEKSEWFVVESMCNFTQYEPQEHAQPSERTEFRIFYDAKNIYIGVWCFDRQADKIVATEMRRDAGLFKNDMVMLVFDTFCDHRNAFYFNFNPLGAKVDGIVTDEGKDVNRDWNGVWYCASSIDSLGWYAEVAIPFSTLRFQEAAEQVWGFNITRTIRRKNEYVSWKPLLRDYGFRAFFKISKLGRIIGLKNLRQQNPLQMKPYLLGGLEHDYEESESKMQYDFGFDFKYNITSNLIADFTYNTDFAQVEADEVQVNLSRFSLFFPEKREFFLEGAGIFRFGEPSRGPGGRAPPTLLFFSRRIGLAEESALPILSGAKISGKISNCQVGLLNMQVRRTDVTGDDNEIIIVPATNFSVFRAKQDILQKSSVGLIFTNKWVNLNQAVRHKASNNSDVNISEDYEKRYNRTFGFDAHFAFLDNLNIDGFIAKSFTPGLTKNDWCYNSNLSWRNDLYGLEFQHLNVQTNFNPEMGFVPRADTKKTFLNLSFSPRPKISFIRKTFFFCENTWYHNQENQLISGATRIGLFNVLQRGGGFFLGYNRSLERIIDEDEFEIRSDKFIIPGIYRGTNFFSGLESDRSRMLATGLFLGYFDFYSGKMFYTDAGFTFTPSRHLSIKASAGINRVSKLNVFNSLTGANEIIDFTTRVIRGRINYSFTPELFIRTLLQWNSDDEELSANFLLNYIYRPGNNFYLVYNELREGPGRIKLHDRTIILKISHLFQL